MNFRTTASLLALTGLMQVATAAPPAIEGAYEVALENLTLPANEYGSVILRECATCERITLRVEGETRYTIEGQLFALKDFRQMALDMDDRDEAMATVMYRLKDGRVRQINVFAAPDEDGGPQLR